MIFVVCRCLAVDAPSPEEKLSWLSDIAQEHTVEWDAHAAALEMLPAEKQGPYGGAPGGGPGFGSSGPNFGPGFPGSGGGGGGGSSGGGGGVGQLQQQSQQPGPYQQGPASNAPFLQGVLLADFCCMANDGHVMQCCCVRAMQCQVACA